MYRAELLPSPSPANKEPPQTALSQGQDGEPEAAAGPWQQLGAQGTPQSPAAPMPPWGSRFQGGLPQSWPLAPCQLRPWAAGHLGAATACQHPP